VAAVRLTRRGRIVLAVIVAVVALGVFWLGTRSAGLASSWEHGAAGRTGPPQVSMHRGDPPPTIAGAVTWGEDQGSPLRTEH
jgi:hypothetical protein